MKKVINTEQLIKSSIEGLIDRLQTTEQFVLKEAPEVLKELLRESVIENLSFLIPAFLFDINFVYALVRTFEFDWKSAESFGYYIIISLVLGVISSFITLAVISNLTTMYFCPKLFFIRAAKNLISKE